MRGARRGVERAGGGEAWFRRVNVAGTPWATVTRIALRCGAPRRPKWRAELSPRHQRARSVLLVWKGESMRWVQSSWVALSAALLAPSGATLATATPAQAAAAPASPAEGG